MPQLSLTYTQRIHLCFDLRSQSGNAGQLKSYWAIEDLIALSDAEKSAIKMETRLINMQEMYLWDASLKIPDKTIDLSDNDLTLLRDIIAKSPHRGQDRAWLQSLLELLERGTK